MAADKPQTVQEPSFGDPEVSSIAWPDNGKPGQCAFPFKNMRPFGGQGIRRTDLPPAGSPEFVVYNMTRPPTVTTGVSFRPSQVSSHWYSGSPKPSNVKARPFVPLNVEALSGGKNASTDFVPKGVKKGQTEELRFAMVPVHKNLFFPFRTNPHRHRLFENPLFRKLPNWKFFGGKENFIAQIPRILSLKRGMLPSFETSLMCISSIAESHKFLLRLRRGNLKYLVIRSDERNSPTDFTPSADVTNSSSEGYSSGINYSDSSSSSASTSSDDTETVVDSIFEAMGLEERSCSSPTSTATLELESNFDENEEYLFKFSRISAFRRFERDDELQSSSSSSSLALCELLPKINGKNFRLQSKGKRIVTKKVALPEHWFYREKVDEEEDDYENEHEVEDPVLPMMTDNATERHNDSETASIETRMPISRMDVLSEQMLHFHQNVEQTQQQLNRKLNLRDYLYYVIAPSFPMCGLYVVGSSLNGFGSGRSDMDLTLMVTNRDIDQRYDAVVILNSVMRALQNDPSIKSMDLIQAKVPILRIKFGEKYDNIQVDLNANNSVAIRNTHLLSYYAHFDWRVRPLVSVVKEWAKRRGINNASRSSFTSYSLVLMVIHYLQCGVTPALLPSLQKLYPKRFTQKSDTRNLNISVPLDPIPPVLWTFEARASLSDLLVGFLQYYAYSFNFDTDAISVRLGHRVERRMVAQNISPFNHLSQWHCICIEEPFTLSNTAHSVYDERMFQNIKKAFVDGFKELDENRDLHAFLGEPQQDAE